MLPLSFEEREYKGIADPVYYDFDLFGEECSVDASGALGHEGAVFRVLCFKVFNDVMTFVYRFTIWEYENRQLLTRIVLRSLRGALPWYLADELERNTFLC